MCEDFVQPVSVAMSDTVANAESMQACMMKFLANQENQLALLERQLTEQKEAAEGRLVQALCKIANLEEELAGRPPNRDLRGMPDVEKLVTERFPASSLQRLEDDALWASGEARVWCHQEMRCLLLVSSSSGQARECINHAFAAGTANAAAVVLLGQDGECCSFADLTGLPCVTVSRAQSNPDVLTTALIALSHMWHQRHPRLQDMLAIREGPGRLALDNELGRLDACATEMTRWHQRLTTAAVRRRGIINQLVQRVETDERETCDFLKAFDELRETVDKVLPQVHELGQTESAARSERKPRRGLQLEVENVVSEILSFHEQHGRWPRCADVPGLTASRARTLGGFRSILDLARSRAS